MMLRLAGRWGKVSAHHKQHNPSVHLPAQVQCFCSSLQACRPLWLLHVKKQEKVICSVNQTWSVSQLSLVAKAHQAKLSHHPAPNTAAAGGQSYCFGTKYISSHSLSVCECFCSIDKIAVISVWLGESQSHLHSNTGTWRIRPWGQSLTSFSHMGAAHVCGRKTAA